MTGLDHIPSETFREGSIPVLETERLVLRAPRLGDAKTVAALANDRQIAENTARIPHPYRLADAKDWIAGANKNADEQHYVITLANGALIGACGLETRDGPSIGYWLGQPYWGKGYATEAGARIVAFAFEVLNAEKLCAGWFYDNPASGCVLEKLGFGACGEEARSCLSRGLDVQCHMVVLDRAAYMTRKSAS